MSTTEGQTIKEKQVRQETDGTYKTETVDKEGATYYYHTREGGDDSSSEEYYEVVQRKEPRRHKHHQQQTYVEGSNQQQTYVQGTNRQGATTSTTETETTVIHQEKVQSNLVKGEKQPGFVNMGKKGKENPGVLTPNFTEQDLQYTARKILVCLNNNQESFAALKEATRMARKSDSLVLLTVSKKKGALEKEQDYNNRVFQRENSLKVAQGYVRQLNKAQKTDTKYEVHVAANAKKIGEAIVEMANRTGSNMIVMGTDDAKSGLADRFSSSVTHYVTKHSRCPVTIVPFRYVARTTSAVVPIN